MKSIFHAAAQRGVANFGWLNSYHSFSFGHYHDPEKMNFGLLRVLNDDTIDGGSGFGAHPHDNMEIISIPLTGALEHKDSTGTNEVMRPNDVQIMSAGTGIKHSEYNHFKDQKTSFLQIWVLPKQRNITPRYDQKTYDPLNSKNKFLTIVAPDDNKAVWINQDAWFSIGNFDGGIKSSYKIKKESNGIYAFVLQGSVNINGESLNKRDAIGIWDTEEIEIETISKVDILLIDIPMN